MDTCTCMAESLHYSPEAITTLLISYIPIQKKSFKKGTHPVLNRHQSLACILLSLNGEPGKHLPFLQGAFDLEGKHN